MNNTLEAGSTNFGIAVECGAAEASLRGEFIEGTWISKPKTAYVGDPRPIAVELLNSTAVSVDRLPESALSFTRKFGALTSPFRPAEKFRFSVSDWFAKQSELQTVWTLVSRAKKNAAPVNVFTESKEYFSFRAGRLTFHTQSLDTFVSLEIASVAASRLCVCANRLEACKAPYFIAADLREKYCSEACASAANRAAKLKWWNENRKGKQNGPHEAR
jgi:hypothetical protein